MSPTSSQGESGIWFPNSLPSNNVLAPSVLFKYNLFFQASSKQSVIFFIFIFFNTSSPGKRKKTTLKLKSGYFCRTPLLQPSLPPA